MSKLFRHFDKSESQCRNVEIVSTISTCRNSLISTSNFNHRIKGGNITIEELLGDSFYLHRTSLKNCGTPFLKQLLEPYTDRFLKWSHFIRMNNLSPRFEPKWFKILKEKVSVIDHDDRIVINDIKI
ncbi:hypothetical protein C1646_749436 [Rhizophagus diaphanus]|nr:hypothetical protein C1646_749436 [Rhizophagus diaphanus] [Rhizophagus sp. MUCL 43196]